MDVGRELLNTPFPQMVEKLAIAVAEAQTKLDLNSSEVAQQMGRMMVTLPDLDDPSKERELSLLAIGMMPTFYAVQEATIEVKMAITMAKTEDKGGSMSAKGGWGPFSASVNASYSSRYAFNQEGSSRLAMKLAPSDPPILLQKYIEALTEKLAGGLVEDESGGPAPERKPSGKG